jgi:catalase
MFTRMSTVIGERGSVDSARDVHGVATRFYTDEGNFGKQFFYEYKLIAY